MARPLSKHKRGAAAALRAALIFCLGGLASAPVSARASLVRVNGDIGGAATWSSSSALAKVMTRNGTVVEFIDPASGRSTKLAALTPGYRWRVMALGDGFALERTKYGCGRYECSKYESGGIEARDLLYEPPGGALRCLAELSRNGCGSPSACAWESAVASGALLAYPSCGGEQQLGGGENEAGTAVFNATTNQTQVVPQITLPLSVSGPWLVGLAAGWKPPPTGNPRGQPPPVLVERNLLTGAEPLRILLAPWTHVRISPRETLPAYAAVQEDGTAVYAIAAGSRTALWTASPAQPLPRLVTTSSAGFGWLADLPLALALRDGRVAFPDAEAQEYGPRRIVIATLSGVRLGALRVIAQDGFDYDGTHVLAPSTPCGKTYLLAWAPGEPPPPVPAVGCMAARLAHLRPASGKLQVELHCPEANVGFVGCATSEISVTAGPISLTAEEEQLFPEDSERLVLRLPRSAQRWLRRHPLATLTLRWGHHSHRRVRVRRL